MSALVCPLLFFPPHVSECDATMQNGTLRSSRCLQKECRLLLLCACPLLYSYFYCLSNRLILLSILRLHDATITMVYRSRAAAHETACAVSCSYLQRGLHACRDALPLCVATATAYQRWPVRLVYSPVTAYCSLFRNIPELLQYTEIQLPEYQFPGLRHSGVLHIYG